MKRNYVDNNGPTHWVASFQPLVFTNMETNNYVENWHNQLKTVYLHRKRNRRVDRLIYILVNDVKPDFIQNISRITLNIGRMGPEERRRRELDAEAINEASVPTMMEEFADDQVTTFKVTSFTSEHIKYDIVVENEAMMSCTCQDFQWSKTVCRHMFLLKRLHTNVSLYQCEYINHAKKNNY